MRVWKIPGRIAAVCAVTVAACGNSGPASSSHPWPLETTIARSLTARFGQPVDARCELLAVPPACRAQLADGTALPLRITSDGHSWTWRLDGHYVDSDAIASHVDHLLGELAVKQTATCGPPRVRRVAPGERVTCALSGGGRAFVDVADDGTLSVELALDRAAADVRGEAVTPERERELDQKSRALEHQLDVDDP